MQKLALVLALTSTIAIQVMGFEPMPAPTIVSAPVTWNTCATAPDKPALPSPPSSIPVFDQKIIDTAMQEIGVTKQVGYNSERVKQYVQETDQELDEYDQDGWCNAFVSWVLKQNGYKYNSLNSVGEVTYSFHQVETPKIGDVVVITGHIAFYAGEATFPGLDNAILLLGGNQAHRVCILPLPKSYVLMYLEPVKAPAGWQPSRHVEPQAMSSYNRFDDRGYAVEALEHNLVVIPH
jgi:uncharacterized protein (TIGR02594 family)